jgi:predicted Zn-dependent peptidase
MTTGTGDVVRARLVAEQPMVGPPRPWRFPSFERREVAGGRMIVCDLPGQPLAMLSLVVDAGAVTEPAGKEGVALLCARALGEGTQARDAYAFAVAGERLGATWRASTDWDSLRCGFEVPAGELVAAAELLAEAVRTPALDDAVLARVHAERLDELLVDQSQPGPRAATAFAAAVWSPESRYARRDGGDLQSLGAITADDVRRFHATRFGPDTVTLVVAGDLSGVDADRVGRAVFDGWSTRAAQAGEPVVTASGRGRRIILVDRPDSVQSMLYVGHDGPKRKVDDFVPMTTMALALGGMFNSRLNYRLREEKGYTYGAFGSFDCRRHGGIFLSRSAVHTDVTAAALTDLVAELQRMHDSGLDESELDRARSYRAGIFPISFASLGDLVVHGHRDDHFDRLREQIQSIELEEVNAAAAARLRPEEAVMVVVGDAAATADALRDSGLGPVEVVRDEG